MSQAPEGNILETLFRTQVQKHPGLKEHLSYYERSPVDRPEKTTTSCTPTFDAFSKQRGAAKLETSCPKVELGLCPHLREARRGPKVIRHHDSPFLHDKEKNGAPFQWGTVIRKAANAVYLPNAASPPSKDKKSACRFHLKGKCSKGKGCAYWHSPNCRLFKNGTCYAGDK